MSPFFLKGEPKTQDFWVQLIDYFAHFRFTSAYTSKPFRYWYFAAYRFGLKVFNQIGTCQYFQLVEKKKCFTQENAKEVVEGLGNDSFVTVTNVI